jgi:transposase
MKKSKKYTNVQVAKLADAFGKSVQTIKRWISKNDDRLTSEKAKKALS